MTENQFHGVRPRDDRDLRRNGRKAALGPARQITVRSSMPGGVLTADQYLALDDQADRFGDGSLRITTRQGIRLSGGVVGDPGSTIRALDDARVASLGAGAEESNVLACPAPYPDRARAQALEIARELSRRACPEAFRIALAFENDNCTHVLSDDLGFLGTRSAGRLEGFEVFVGGGLGMSHGEPSSFPRLAEPIGWIPPERAVEVTEAVISVQRDHGDRSSRGGARLDHLVHERGMEWLRPRVEAYLDARLDPSREVKVQDVLDHVGWHAQGDGSWYYGLHVENGRVTDFGSKRLRTGVRRLVERFGAGVRLTAQQNLLLTDIADVDREAFAAEMRAHGLEPEELTAVRRWALVCEGLPTGGPAPTESDRVMADVLDALEREVEALGLAEERFAVRMTGRPEYWAGPYTAEIGLVERGRDRYTILVGGSIRGDHLGFELADLVQRDELVATVRPLLERFAERENEEEDLGSFVRRVGRKVVRSWTGVES